MILRKQRFNAYYWMLILPWLLVGCATNTQLHCLSGEALSVNELFYFGTDKPNGVVTAEEWKYFLLHTVTPHFPNGFTHWQGLGQWQGKDGQIVSENALILNIIHPDNDQSENASRAIAHDYKLRFNQEAVLRVKNFVCVRFY